jgi:hypothetical protein
VQVVEHLPAVSQLVLDDTIEPAGVMPASTLAEAPSELTAAVKPLDQIPPFAEGFESVINVPVPTVFQGGEAQSTGLLRPVAQPENTGQLALAAAGFLAASAVIVLIKSRRKTAPRFVRLS